MPVEKAVIVVALAVAAVVSLSFAAYVLRPVGRTMTWEEAVRVTGLLRGSAVTLSSSVRVSGVEVETEVYGRKAIVRVLRLCGFGNLTPTANVKGWLLERGLEGDACIVNVPEVESGVMTLFAPDPDPSRVPSETRRLEFAAVSRVVVVYQGGEYREVTVRERRLSMCPCRARG